MAPSSLPHVSFILPFIHHFCIVCSSCRNQRLTAPRPAAGPPPPYGSPYASPYRIPPQHCRRQPSRTARSAALRTRRRPRTPRRTRRGAPGGGGLTSSLSPCATCAAPPRRHRHEYPTCGAARRGFVPPARRSFMRLHQRPTEGANTHAPAPQPRGGRAPRGSSRPRRGRRPPPRARAVAPRPAPPAPRPAKRGLLRD